MISEPRCHRVSDVLHGVGRYEYLAKVGDRVFTASLAPRPCPTCGRALVPWNGIHRADSLVAEHLAREGPISGDSFRFIRKAAGLTAVEIAALLDVTPEAISKWENGKNPMPRAPWLVLSEVALDRSALLAKLRRFAEAGAFEEKTELGDLSETDEAPNDEQPSAP